MKLVASIRALVALTLIVTPAAHAQRGTQRATDAVLLVNKRLGQQQWAIVVDMDLDIAAGNVFNLDGSDPAFVFCFILTPGIDAHEDFADIANVDLDCFVAPGCDSMPCGLNVWDAVGTRSVPGSFFLPAGAGGPVVPPPTATPTAIRTATPVRTPTPVRTSSGPVCCRVCTTGKPCGNSCIASHLTCHQPPGCACRG